MVVVVGMYVEMEARGWEDDMEVVVGLDVDEVNVMVEEAMGEMWEESGPVWSSWTGRGGEGMFSATKLVIPMSLYTLERGYFFSFLKQWACPPFWT